MVTSSEARSKTPGAHFVDPQVLARIDNLELVARTVVEGFITGLHRSPFLGFSIDFAEHLLFDISRSMDFATDGLSKFDYGRFLAASLSYFSHQQRDRVGLVTFDEDIVDYVPPSAKHMDIVLHMLDRARPAGKGSFRKPMEKVAELTRRKGLVVLVSDCYEDPEEIANSLAKLQFRGNDVVVFHLLDPAEISLPFQKAVHFEDMESGEQMPVVPDRIREKYTGQVTDHVRELSRRLRAHRIDYTMVDTSTPLDYALFEYLAERVRFSRVR
jgi:uncharacterized protein (DUF58 family)